MICEECGQEFKPRKTTQRFCCRDCFNTWQNHKIALTCRTCGKSFSVSPVHKDNAKYCSHKCYGIGRQGTEPANKLPRVTKTCPVCQKTFKVSISNKQKYCSPDCFHQAHAVYMKEHASSMRKRITKICQYCKQAYEIIPSWEPTSRFCSYDCLNAWKRTIIGKNHPLYTQVELTCEFCGKKYNCKPSIVHRSRFCSKQCHGAWVVRNTHSPTSIELAVAKMLKSMYLAYTTEKQMGRFICDLVLIDYKLVIECDGTYWHGSNQQKRKDRRKDSWLKTQGYKVLRLPEAQINKTPTRCIQRIASAIKSLPQLTLL